MKCENQQPSPKEIKEHQGRAKLLALLGFLEAVLMQSELKINQEVHTEIFDKWMGVYFVTQVGQDRG